ncbi:DUF6366 family protein (plasmid) [Pseudalkalibacillus hwajinpoensis]|uniref:DUF6366 family protein n=1 Tax=Guptibacillus hwajinpoensis TaxID=208199 RepID=UPI00325AD60F
MSNPKRERERLRQKELKNNPTGNMRDGMNRSEGTNLVDLVGSLGWKGTIILIVILVVAYIIYMLFIR